MPDRTRVTGFVPADTRRGEDAAEWGEGAGGTTSCNALVPARGPTAGADPGGVVDCRRGVVPESGAQFGPTHAPPRVAHTDAHSASRGSVPAFGPHPNVVEGIY